MNSCFRGEVYGSGTIIATQLLLELKATTCSTAWLRQILLDFLQLVDDASSLTISIPIEISNHT